MIWVGDIVGYDFYRITNDLANVIHQVRRGKGIQLVVLPECSLFFQHGSIALFSADRGRVSVSGTVNKFAVNYRLKLFLWGHAWFCIFFDQSIDPVDARFLVIFECDANRCSGFIAAIKTGISIQWIIQELRFYFPNLYVIGSGLLGIAPGDIAALYFYHIAVGCTCAFYIPILSGLYRLFHDRSGIRRPVQSDTVSSGIICFDIEKWRRLQYIIKFIVGIYDFYIIGISWFWLLSWNRNRATGCIVSAQSFGWGVIGTYSIGICVVADRSLISIAGNITFQGCNPCPSGGRSLRYTKY